ncbi:YfbM family protein [Streptomyces sp. B5E4]|uniref:YfbM family protein n=1 Tax=Streptomyces sp. B5E4 TaxID=3153568 RepID=UPI00325DD99E
MSMIGEYARVTPAELDRAVREPDWARGFIFELLETETGAEEDAGSDITRFPDTDKAWVGRHRVSAPPRRLPSGRHLRRGIDTRSRRLGYGPPRYLTPEQVRTAAEVLGTTSSDRLVHGVSQEDLARADVYPLIVWERGESFDYVRGHYEALVEYFRGAAGDGDGLPLWLGQARSRDLRAHAVGDGADQD